MSFLIRYPVQHLLAQAGTFRGGVAVTSQILCISITLNKKILHNIEFSNLQRYYTPVCRKCQAVCGYFSPPFITRRPTAAIRYVREISRIPQLRNGTALLPIPRTYLPAAPRSCCRTPRVPVPCAHSSDTRRRPEFSAPRPSCAQSPQALP